MNQFLPSSGLTGAKRRLGTSQSTQINVQNCLVILSSHKRPSVAVTPRVKMVVILRTSSVCIIIMLTAVSATIPSSKSNCLSDNNITSGWNDFVKAAHSEARDAFKFWIRSSKPRYCEVFDDMKTSRAKFKYLQRQCRRNEASVRADILGGIYARRILSCSGNVSKQNNSSTSLADTVGGTTGLRQ